MKQLIYAFLVAGLLCSLGGCQTSTLPHESTGSLEQTELPQPNFPLEEEVITDALEQTGLPGVISEAETHSNVEGQILYVLRDPTKTYADSENKALIAGILSAITEGERVLFVTFRSAPDEPATLPFVWKDWKQHIVFATLLFGGFEDEEEVYHAFSDKETPENEESFEWEAQLPGGYCTVRYRLYASKITHTFPEPIVNRASYMVDVAIYESKSLYEKLHQNFVDGIEEMQPSLSETPN